MKILRDVLEEEERENIPERSSLMKYSPDKVLFMGEQEIIQNVWSIKYEPDCSKK